MSTPDPNALEPAPESPEKLSVAEMAARMSRRAKVRSDLLTPSDAWKECLKRLANVLPDLPALGLVLIFGALGGLLGRIWPLRLPLVEGQPPADISTYPLGLVFSLGAAGAVAAVFLLAKTDTSKLIHCSLVALFSGMAGPVLVIKALTAVADIKPGSVGAGADPVANSNDASAASESLQTTFADIITGNAGAATQQVTKVADSATSALTTIAALKAYDPQSANLALAPVQSALSNALRNLGEVLPQSKQAVSAVLNIKEAAEKAGASAVATEAQQILDANSNSPTVKQALSEAAAPLVYFLTPPELTDDQLLQPKGQLQQLYPAWDFQGTVHPARKMDNGVEVVYYDLTEADDANNRKTADLVVDYLKRFFGASAGSSRRGILENDKNRTQFDLHIGPDGAENYLNRFHAPAVASSSPPAPPPEHAAPTAAATREASEGKRQR